MKQASRRTTNDKTIIIAKKFFSSLLIAIFCLSFSSCALTQKQIKQKQLDVFSNGQPHVYFNVKLKNKNVANMVLKDFEKYFKIMTGKKLPMNKSLELLPIESRILPKGEKSKGDSFGLQNANIDISEKGILITASTELGVANALYTLLDYWGCRWIMAGELGEVIPKRKTLSLPYGKMAVRLSMDSRVEGSWMCGDGYNQWLWRNRMGRIHWLSSQHYWHYAFPKKDYFKDHPEYYSLIGGVRKPTQLCVSNPKVRELMKKKADEYFSKHPTADSFPMDPADNHFHCQCANCAKLDEAFAGVKHKGANVVTDRVADFANCVAKHLEKTHPGKMVGFYAYANKKLPPRTVKLNKNIFIPYTRDSSCTLHYMPRNSCPTSKEYWTLLKDWMKICDKMYCYEYEPVSWTGSLPCPVYLERAKAIKKQHAIGIKGVITDKGYRADATLFVNRYITLRMLADTNRDPEKELKSMCEAFFGPAGSEMFDFYMEMAKVVESDVVLGFGIAGYEKIFSAKIITTARKELNKALSIAKKRCDSTIIKRVAMVDLAQRYLEAYVAFFNNLQQSDYNSSVKDWRKINSAIDSLSKAGKYYIRSKNAKRRIKSAVMKSLAKKFPKEMRFITRWEIIGPGDNSKMDAFQKAKPLQVKNNKFFLGDKEVEAINHASPEGFVDFSKIFAKKIKNDSFHYGYAYRSFRIENGENVTFKFSSFNPIKIWLNGKLIHSRAGLNADCPDQYSAKGVFKVGENTIVIMVPQYSPTKNWRWGFWLRVIDSKGKHIDINKKTPVNVRKKMEFSLNDTPAKYVVNSSANDKKVLKEAVKQIKTGKLKNLIPHPGFESLSKLSLSTFVVWPPAIRSKVALDNSHTNPGGALVRFTNKKAGSLNRFFKVKPGEKYLLGFECMQQGKGTVHMSVGWRENGNFFDNSLNRVFHQKSTSLSAWKTVAGIVTVPPNADQLVYAISVSGFASNSPGYVDNLFLYKLR